MPTRNMTGCSRQLTSGSERNWPHFRSISMNLRVDSLISQKAKVSDSWALTSAVSAASEESGGHIIRLNSSNELRCCASSKTARLGELLCHWRRQSMFGFVKDWVERKVRRHLMRARKLRGFGWKRWSRRQLYEELRLFSQ